MATADVVSHLPADGSGTKKRRGAAAISQLHSRNRKRPREESKAHFGAVEVEDAKHAGTPPAPREGGSQSESVWAYIGRKYQKQLMSINPDEDRDMDFTVRESLLLRSLQARFARATAVNQALRHIHGKLLCTGKAAAPGASRAEAAQCAAAQDSGAVERKIQLPKPPPQPISRSPATATAARPTTGAEPSPAPAEESASEKLVSIVRQSLRAGSVIRGVLGRQGSFCITDPHYPDNPIIFASPGFMEITGYKREQIIGRNCRFLQGADTDPKALARIRDGVRAGREVNELVLNYCVDGRAFWNQLHISPILNGSGIVRYFVGVICDVTSLEDSSLEDVISAGSSLCSSGSSSGCSSPRRDADDGLA